MTRVAILLGILGIGVAIVAAVQSATSASGFRELHRVEVAGTSNVEVIMGLVQRPGGSVSAKHYHPGGEFGFVLEGAVTVATEREPEATLEAGASFYQPPGEWHIVSSSSEGAKAVVFRVLKKGQPMIVAVD